MRDVEGARDVAQAGAGAAADAGAGARAGADTGPDAGAQGAAEPVPLNVSRLAEALASARLCGRPLQVLPCVDVPLSFEDAMAVQREVGRRLGAAVAGWKAGLIPGVRFTCAAVFAADVLESPAVYRLPCVPSEGEATAFVEGEVAFSLAHDLPPRVQPYSNDEVAHAVDRCHAAIEIGNPRMVHFDAASLMHKLADSMGNGAIVWGAGTSGWRAIDWSALRVRMMLDGKTVVDHVDSGKGADPLATLVALANARNREPLRAGQVVITGNRTGFNVARTGTRIHVAIGGLGEVSVQLV